MFGANDSSGQARQTSGLMMNPQNWIRLFAEDTNDIGNLLMLFGLYFVHSVPLAFSWGTMPILLREQASYLVVASFVLTQYPYSLKILWSPVVETLHFSWLGPKKSWLIPSFLGNAVLIYGLAFYQDEWVHEIAAGRTLAVLALLTVWSCISFFCANIRVALDAWSLELISPANIRWFGATVTTGEICGTFVAFNLFLGLSIVRGDRATESDAAVHPKVHIFFIFVALMSALTALALLCRREAGRHDGKQSLGHKYRIILRILALPRVWTLFAVHVVSLIGFITNDTVTVLQLVKNGFTDSDIATIATIDFPFVVATGLLVSRYIRNRHPLEVWRLIFPIRLAAAVIAQCGIMLIYQLRDHSWRWYIAVIPDTLTSSLEVAMFICIITFHAKVSDPRHGAIYLPLLATTLDLRYAILQFISTKIIGILDGDKDVKTATRLLDGYQIVNAICVVLAIPMFWFYLRPATMWLQTQSTDGWHVDKTEIEYEQVSLEDRDE